MISYKRGYNFVKAELTANLCFNSVKHYFHELQMQVKIGILGSIREGV